MNTEAKLQIHRNGAKKVTSVSVTMPIWIRQSDHGNLIVQLPLLGIDTIAKSEEDADHAIEEAITCFCMASDRFGQGLEKELEALGWVRVDGSTGEPMLGYSVDQPDDLIDRLIKTGENYVNPHLEIA